MAYVLVRHKVEDYERWKKLYDAHEDTRNKSGSKGARLFKVKENSNEVVALFEWDTIENAKKFAGSEDLKEYMRKAGVSDVPDVFFLEQVQKTNA